MDVFGQGGETKLSKLCNSVENILIGGGFRKGTIREKKCTKIIDAFAIEKNL